MRPRTNGFQNDADVAPGAKLGAEFSLTTSPTSVATRRCSQLPGKGYLRVPKPLTLGPRSLIGAAICTMVYLLGAEAGTTVSLFAV